MYEKGRRKGTVRFAYRPRGGKISKVQLAGTFNDWQPATMLRQKNGAFVKIVEVPPGTHEYKFIVDGEWQHDVDHSNWAVNVHGTLNSVAIVE